MLKKLGLFVGMLFCCFTTVFTQETETEMRTASSYYLMQGEQQLNVNVGLLNTTDFAFSLFGQSGAGDPSPSLNLSYDYAVTSQIRIGAFAGYYRVDATQSSTISAVTESLSGLGVDIGSILSGFGVDDFLCETLMINCPEEVTGMITDIQERVNVLSFGGKLMYARPIVEKFDTYVSTYLGYSINNRETITEEALNTASEQLGLNVSVPDFIYYGAVGARYYVTPKLGIYGEFGQGNVHTLKLGMSVKL